MSTVIERSPADVVVAGSSARHPRSRRAVPFGGFLAAAAVALGTWAAIEGSGGRWLVAGLTVAAWAAGGFIVSFRRGDDPVGPLVALVAAVGGATALGAAAFESGGGEDWSAGLRLTATALMVAVLFHLAMSVPDGHVRTTGHRVAVGVGYLVAAVLVAVGWSDRTDLPVPAVVAFGAAAAVVATFSFVAACQAAGRRERATLQWMGWGVVTAAAVAVSAWGLDALIGWPRQHRADRPGGVGDRPLRLRGLDL